MLETLNKIKEGLFDILLPRYCLGCGREGQHICKDCEIFLGEVENTMPGLISVWEYEGLMEKLIYKIKFDGMYHIIDELTERALEKIDLKLPEDTVITYVPMWPKKERQRGFNQSALLAHKLGLLLTRGKQQPVRVVPLLEKIRDNRSQVGLNPQERIENVKGVFGVLKPSFNSEKLGFVVPQNVLLVDDVYTTGATIRECIKVLKKRGVENIWVFTLSKKMNIQNC